MVYRKSWQAWFESKLSLKPVSESNFAIPFYRATSRAKKIKFNLDDVDIDAAKNFDQKLARSIDPIEHPEIGGRGLTTEWELRQVMQNKRLFEKTEFYYGDNVKLTAADVAAIGIKSMY